MLKQLRLKFILVNMTTVVLMLCIIFGVVLHSTHKDLEEENIRMMQMAAIEPLRPGRPDAATKEIRLPFFILDTTSSGTIVARGGSYYDLSDENFLEFLAKTALSSQEPVGMMKDYNLRYLRAQTPMGERIVFSDISSEQSAMESLVRNCLLIGFASFFAFLVISIFFARWAVKPVEETWDQQRQFVADASHELKTPLTVITTSAELLQSGSGDEASRLQLSSAILSMAQQMRSLTESLLNLARVDAGTAQTSFAPVDLSALIAETLLPFEPVFFEKGLTLSSAIDAGICLNGSEAHLRQVAEILLDNAQKYADAPGSVALSLKRQGRSCLLSVASPGSAISSEDLKNIFKRFYRIDPARTRDGSYGLGLSIAQSIVEEHRGKIWAESAGGVNTFFVQLAVNL